MLTITREMKKKCYVFNIDMRKDVFGKANYTFGLFLQNITVTTGRNTLQLKQTNWLLKLLNALPLLNSEILTPYKFYVNGQCRGKSKNMFLKPCFLFDIEDVCFEVRLHNDNFISLMMNDRQIALLKKELNSQKEKNVYKATYLSQCMKEEMLLLFCAFIDLVFYKNNSFIALYRKEKNYVFDDEYEERTKWMPNK